VSTANHRPGCRREIRPVPDKAYYEMRWVCVSNCRVAKKEENDAEV